MDRDEDKKTAAPGVHSDPMDYLLAEMNDASASRADRLAAAVALMPYFHESLNDSEEEEASD
ncbi:hypothetical protein [Pseudomonas sp.]|uniref:hypothetical protein n=1 Tax=Pseudomonas sp. TaxID=306 RepID=UPI003FD87115